MQILVLGMHRSGTSAVTRLLNMMGAYLGTEESLKGSNQENVKGFWERDDFLDVNKNLLEALGHSWSQVADFDLDALNSDSVRDTGEARNILTKLDAHRPWAVKDPRLCLVLPYWRNLLEVPICVHIYRNPLQVAKSLQTRNGFSVPVGIALWEKYNLCALAGSEGLPRIFIEHSELMTNPVLVVKNLYKELVGHGVRGLELPTDREITSFIDENLFRERDTEKLAEEFLNAQQRHLLQAFKGGSAGDLKPVPQLSAGALEVLKEFEASHLQSVKVKQQDSQVVEERLERERLQRELDQRSERILEQVNTIKGQRREHEKLLNTHDLLQERLQSEVDQHGERILEQDKTIEKQELLHERLQSEIDRYSERLLEQDKTIEAQQVEYKHLQNELHRRGERILEQDKATEAQQRDHDKTIEIQGLLHEHLQREIEQRSERILEQTETIKAQRLEHEHLQQELTQRSEHILEQKKSIEIQRLEQDKMIEVQRLEHERLQQELTQRKKRVLEQEKATEALLFEHERLQSEIDLRSERILEQEKTTETQRLEEERLRREIAQHDERIQEQAETIEAQRIEHEHLQLELAQRSEHILEQEKTTEAQRLEEERLRREIAQHNERIQEQAETIGTQRLEYGKTIEAQRIENERLQREIAQHDERIQEQAETIGVQRIEHERLQDEVNQRIEQVLEQEKKLEARGLEQERLQHELVQRSERIAEEEETTEALQFEQKRLQREVDQRDECILEHSKTIEMQRLEHERLQHEMNQRSKHLLEQDKTIAAQQLEQERLQRELDQRGKRLFEQDKTIESQHLEQERVQRELSQNRERRVEQDENIETLQFEQERLQRELDQRGKRIGEWGQLLSAARQDLTRFVDLLTRIETLFELANRNWWWRIGLKLRRVAGVVKLKRQEPNFPYDRAKPLFAKAHTIHKKAIERALGEAQTARISSAHDTVPVPAPSRTISDSTSSVASSPPASPPKLVARQGLSSSPKSLESETAQRFSELKWTPSVDIVVTIHNALDDVRRCLESIVTNTKNRYTIIAVNDGSDSETKTYLEAFEGVHPQCTVIHNENAQGYTVAANQGLKASTADYAILLNSDTVVPKDWLGAIIDCAQSNPNIGIVGPISNAASFQSVPERKDAHGDWSVNALPPGFTIDDMASLVRAHSESVFPRVPFVNGFCYMIKRSVIDTIGYLDEATFPDGYGEESDYSIRAADAGFELAIADQTFVFHSKSKSFGHSRRLELSRTGYEALKKKHGPEKLAAGVREMEENATLTSLRERIKYALEEGAFRNLPTASERGTGQDSVDVVVQRAPSSEPTAIPNEEYERFIRDIESKDVPEVTGAVPASAVLLVLDEWEREHAEHSLSSLLEIERRGAIHIISTDVEALPKSIREGSRYKIYPTERSAVAQTLNTVFNEISEDFVILMRGGDRLGEKALAHLDAFAKRPLSFQEHLGAIVLNHDQMNEQETRTNPCMKPGWSPAFLLEYDYIDSAVWLNRAAVQVIGGFSTVYAYEYLRDLLLRLDDRKYVIDKIDHVDLHRGARSNLTVSKDEQRRLISDAAARHGAHMGQIESLAYGPRPVYDPRDTLVSIIIPFRNRADLLRQCVESIFNTTSYGSYELLLVDNQSDEDETAAYLQSLSTDSRVRILRYDKPFNYSRINNFAAGYATGDVLLFLNNDTQVITANWLNELVGDAIQPGVGSVGGVLYFDDGSIQHAGIVVGLNGLAGHVFSGLTDIEVPAKYLRHRREVSAITGACMAIRKKVFEEVGRFDETFQITGNDVELGLRMRDFGYRNILNPNVRLFHYEKSSRKHIHVKDIDIDLSLLHYQPYLDEGDPYYSNCFSPNSSRMTLTTGEAPAHIAFREKYIAERSQRKQQSAMTLSLPSMNGNGNGNGRKLQDEEVIAYDVTPEILAENRLLMQRFYRDPYVNLEKVLWFVPHFDHVYRGGIFTIFRTANYFSERAGTVNTIVLYGHRKHTLDAIELELREAFPNLLFELMEYSPKNDINELPESDVAFCTLWTSAYYLVRYNKCKAKYSFLQDYEPCFYPAGTIFGLIEQTYKFGFVGIANTPGVADMYRTYNPRVDYFVPAVDQSIYYPRSHGKPKNRPYRIVFYGRPANSRNAFRLGIEALKKVKAVYGDQVEIVSVGTDFESKEYGIEGVIDNLGILGSLEDVAEVYRNSDIGLVFMFSAHPSYQPFEFMASGCVTVTNDNPRNRWLLKNDENAILVESTVSCVASKIVQVLENPELRTRVVAGGLATTNALNWPDALEKIYSYVRNPCLAREGIAPNVRV